MRFKRDFATANVFGCLTIATTVCIVSVVAVSPEIALAQYPVIELTAIEPSAAQAGSTVEVKVTSGNQLDAIDRLQFSDPRIAAEVLREPVAADAAEGTVGAIKSGQFKLNVAADLPPGRYEVRAVGAYGISNPRVFVVSQHPVVKPAAASQSASEPTVIDEHLATTGGAVVVHQSTAARVDYFRLSANAKQPLRITLDAQRIDSRLIAQLRLFDTQGRLLTLARGADGFDPSVTIPASADSQFTIAVSDFLFRGGPNYFYQLRIEPIADADPASVSGSSAMKMISATDSTTLSDFDRLELAAIHKDVVSASPESIQWITIAPGSEPIKLTPPCLVASDFPQPIVARPRAGQTTDHHAFEFDAEQGKRYTIEVVSQRLGQPADPRMSIVRREVKPDMTEVWHAVASEDDQPVVGDAALRIRSRDPVVSFVAPAAATYRIKVSNIDSGGSLPIKPAYRLSIREPVADFSLLAAIAYPHNDPAQSRPFGSQLMRGDAIPVRVLANRRDGFVAPITVSINGLPEGVSARPVTIAANQSEATLIVQASETAAAWSGAIEVVGQSIGEGEPLRATAMPATFAWGSGDQRDFIRGRLATDLMIVVTDKQTTPMSITLIEKPADPPADKPAEAAPADAAATPAAPPPETAPATELTLSSKPGTNISLAVKVARREGAATAITLRPRNLPPGVTAADLAIAADKSDGVIELKIAADAKPGLYSLWFLGETKVKFKPITQTDARDLTVFVPSTSANLELTATP
ncbi:MAG TPA: hypothetical protein DDZ51_04000 [Planctomycetaceae bacterium]|nr:hypothetical protein [Planctomycetaceae bacterium]